MVYVPSSVDISKYKYLVRSSDNYIVLSRNNSISVFSGDFDYLDTITVYLEPSFVYLPSKEYFTYSQSFTDISSYMTHDLYYSRDFPIILILSFIVLFSLILIINGFTRIVQKGGVLFPHWFLYRFIGFNLLDYMILFLFILLLFINTVFIIMVKFYILKL